jgi:hypothetical protein
MADTPNLRKLTLDPAPTPDWGEHPWIVDWDNDYVHDDFIESVINDLEVGQTMVMERLDGRLYTMNEGTGFYELTNPETQSIAMQALVTVDVPWDSDAPVQEAYKKIRTGGVVVVRSHNLIASKGLTRQAIKAAGSGEPDESKDFENPCGCCGGTMGIEDCKQVPKTHDGYHHEGVKGGPCSECAPDDESGLSYTVETL